MNTCKHSFRWHNEGSPLEHTKLVTRAIYERMVYTAHGVCTEEYLLMMSATMLHDIGKPSTMYWDEKTIMQMWGKMEFPNKNECYELWFVDQCTNETYKV